MSPLGLSIIVITDRLSKGFVLLELRDLFDIVTCCSLYENLQDSKVDHAVRVHIMFIPMV